MSISHSNEYLDYKTIATLNQQHHIYLVQNTISKQVFVKKELTVYSLEVYQMLKEHPIFRIPKIVDYYEYNHKLTVIEEFINGELLCDKIERGDMYEDDICNYIYQLCEILEQLHHNMPPIVHRDIKPSNVMITTRGEVFLLDFNAAKFHSQQGNRTSDTVLLGTQGYAAPEQYGFGESSPKTDIYSLGILFKECLDSIDADEKKYESIINHCTRMDPSDRYADITELKNQLFYFGTHRYERKKEYGHGYALPGFRTHKPWRMFFAGFVYLILLVLIFTVEEKETGMISYLGNFFVVLWIFLTILITFNYRGILDIGRKSNVQVQKKRVIRGIIFNFALLVLIGMILAGIKNVFGTV